MCCLYISHSFETGIVNVFSSLKWRKIFLFMKNNHINQHYLIKPMNWASITKYVIIFNWLYSVYNLPRSSTECPYSSRDTRSKIFWFEGWFEACFTQAVHCMMWCSVRRSISRLVTGSVHLCAISTPHWAYSPVTIPALGTYRKNCHHSPTRYSFTLEWSEALKAWNAFPCYTTSKQRRPNVERG